MVEREFETEAEVPNLKINQIPENRNLFLILDIFRIQDSNIQILYILSSRTCHSNIYIRKTCLNLHNDSNLQLSMVRGQCCVSIGKARRSMGQDSRIVTLKIQKKKNYKRKENY